MSFKKNPTIEELTSEVEALREQVVNGNARYNALKKQFDNHPALRELNTIKNTWFYKLLTWSWS